MAVTIATAAGTVVFHSAELASSGKGILVTVDELRAEWLFRTMFSYLVIGSSFLMYSAVAHWLFGGPTMTVLCAIVAASFIRWVREQFPGLPFDIDIRHGIINIYSAEPIFVHLVDVAIEVSPAKLRHRSCLIKFH